MANRITPVKFHGATLITIDINGVAHVALRPICEAIGLDWQAQHARIMRHPVLAASVSVTKTDAQRGNHTLKAETLVLPLDKLNGWLFGVNAARVRPELRDKLIQFQRECFDVLHQHFVQKHAPQPKPLALPKPDIDVRALMLTGLTDPVPLNRSQQALVNRRAWLLAHDAYEIAREHIERRIAFKTIPRDREDPSNAFITEVVDDVNLNNALTHDYHSALRRQLRTAQCMDQIMHSTVLELQNLVDAADTADRNAA